MCQQKSLNTKKEQCRRMTSLFYLLEQHVMVAQAKTIPLKVFFVVRLSCCTQEFMTTLSQRGVHSEWLMEKHIWSHVAGLRNL